MIQPAKILQEIDSLSAVGDFCAALAVCEEALAESKKTSPLGFKRIDLLYELSRQKEALVAAEEYAAMYPADESALTTYARALFENLFFEEAIELSLKLISQNKANYKASFLLAHLYSHLQLEKEAQTAMERSVCFAPNPPAIFPSLKDSEFIELIEEAAFEFETVSPVYVIYQIGFLPSMGLLKMYDLRPGILGYQGEVGITFYKRNIEWNAPNRKHAFKALQKTFRELLFK